MAGIRPQARGSSFTGIHIAFVVAIVLCVVSWIGLGLLYTSQAKLEQDRDAAIKDRDTLATMGEMSRFKAQLTKPGQTILGRLADERSGMAKVIDGNNDRDLATVQAEVAARYDAIRTAARIDNPDAFTADLPLLNGVQMLYDNLVTQRDRRIQAEANLKKAQDDLAQVTAARDKAVQQFDQTVAGVSSQLQDAQAELANYQKSNEQILATLKGNASRAEDLVRKQTERHRAEMAEQEKNLDKMRTRLNDALAMVKSMRPQPDELAVARAADGKVIRALPNDPYVYVNLGAKDHLALGMTFAVYDSREGIPATGQGKATVEISTIYDDVAAARIVSRHGDVPVMAGDVIGNAIYSKNHKNRFVVLGRFDLDNGGMATTEGTDRVKAMIKEWGGDVADAIDTTTDFVVVGEGPGQPIAPGASASPIDKQRYQQKMEQYDAFQKVVEEAKSMMVPILNQEQFLHFVGYNLNAMRTGRMEAAAR